MFIKCFYLFNCNLASNHVIMTEPRQPGKIGNVQNHAGTCF